MWLFVWFVLLCFFQMSTKTIRVRHPLLINPNFIVPNVLHDVGVLHQRPGAWIDCVQDQSSVFFFSHLFFFPGQDQANSDLFSQPSLWSEINLIYNYLWSSVYVTFILSVCINPLQTNCNSELWPSWCIIYLSYNIKVAGRYRGSYFNDLRPPVYVSPWRFEVGDMILSSYNGDYAEVPDEDFSFWSSSRP